MTRALAEVIARLKRGDVVHMQLGDDGKPLWWMEGPLLDIDPATMAAAQTRIEIQERGDSLFGMASNSQTWQARR